MLVLIDDINHWDAVSQFLDPYKTEPIHARNLQLVDAFSSFQVAPPFNGAVCFAFSSSASLKTEPSYYRPPTVKRFDTRWYDNGEFTHAVIHYHISRLLTSKVDRTFINKHKLLTGCKFQHNARTLRLIALSSVCCLVTHMQFRHFLCVCFCCFVSLCLQLCQPFCSRTHKLCKQLAHCVVLFIVRSLSCRPIASGGRCTQHIAISAACTYCCCGTYSKLHTVTIVSSASRDPK